MAADQPEDSRLRAVWPTLRRLLEGERASVATLIALGLPSGFLEAAVVAIVAQTAVALAAGNELVTVGAAGLSMELPIGRAILVGVILASVILVIDVVTSVLPPRIVANTQARLRGELFEAFVHARWEVQSRERNGHLQDVMTTQVGQTAQLVLACTRGIGATLMVVGLLGSAFLLAPLAAIGMAVAGSVLFLAFRPMAQWAREYSRSHAMASLGFAETVTEAVSLGEEFHVFGVQGAQQAIVDHRIQAVRGPFFRSQAMLGVVASVYSGAVILLLVAGIAVLQIFPSGQIGAIGAVVLVLLRSLSAGQEVQSTYTQLHNSAPYLEHVAETIDGYRQAAVTPGTRPLGSIDSFAAEQVAYAYEPGAAPALREATFTVTAGQAIGIVGPSGAGKSTLVQVLLRLREPTSGRYLVNGLDASEYDRADWSHRVAFVPQEPRLLQGTVAENIRFHRPDIDQQTLERVADLAHIRDEIEAWPGGWDRPIGQRADAVSGGQRQRLCLARALATDPDVLVLDEPTSALDPESERLVQESLEALRARGTTLFIIAHRPTTLAFVDQVIVVDEGRVIAAGPLDQLLASGSPAARAVLEMTQDEARGRDA